MVKISFLGAAQTVTGSMHLVEANSHRVLLDCGMFQGRREESNARNRNLPFDPKTIDRVILSHAHIDHSGNIPTLCKSGFRGDILCTSATRDLANVMLRDSAHI
jgi:metallo-beta-lactamase family protein